MLQAQLIDKPLLTEVGQIAREIGNTPLLRIDFLSNDDVQVMAKAEWMQLSGSVKARAAYHIIRRAVIQGWLHRERRLLDASSGNTAIAYATILKQLGIGCTICLPSNASAQRISMLERLDAEIVLTSPFEGTEGAQAEARRLAAAHPDRYYYADQYSNPANIEAHYHGTALEVLEQTSGELTHFVAGLGTTGTFSGSASRLKRHNVRTIALQPDGPLHIMEGWKHLETADVPSIYTPDLVDEMLEVSSEDAMAMISTFADREGIRISPSSAANLVGAQRIAGQLDSGIVVTVLPDSIERYAEIEKELFGS
ncbi:MAG: cysteine synthase family protein [Saprospiraceae bacterium]|nr:cysteine synthase family protein [Saprospiraceae bacterium]